MKHLFHSINEEKDVSVRPVFPLIQGQQTFIRMKAGATIKAHTSKIPAVLLCLEGQVTYHVEGKRDTLAAGDFVDITPDELHWLTSETGCKALLLK